MDWSTLSPLLRDGGIILVLAVNLWAIATGKVVTSREHETAVKTGERESQRADRAESMLSKALDQVDAITAMYDVAAEARRSRVVS